MFEKDFDLGPISKVEVNATGDKYTLVFIRELPHPPERVWACLTEPKELEQWAPFVPDHNLERLGSTKFKMIDGQTIAEFPAEVLKVDKPHALEYTWGDDLLVWTLEASTKGTKLTLKHTVESQDWIPKVAAGWHICLVVAHYLMEGRPVGIIVGNRAKDYGWEKLHDEYASQLDITGTGFPDETFQPK